MLDFQRRSGGGGAMNFFCPGLLNKYINFFKDKLLTHVHEFLKLTVKF